MSMTLIKTLLARFITAIGTKKMAFWALRTLWSNRTAAKWDDSAVDCAEALIDGDIEKAQEAMQKLGYELVKIAEQ